MSVQLTYFRCAKSEKQVGERRARWMQMRFQGISSRSVDWPGVHKEWPSLSALERAVKPCTLVWQVIYLRPVEFPCSNSNI